MRIGRLDQKPAADALKVVVVVRGAVSHRQQAQILFATEDRHGIGLIGRRNNHFGKLFGDFFGRCRVHRAVKRNNAAERTLGVAGERLLVSLENARSDGRSARVGVLHNHACGRRKAPHGFPRRIAIGNVVVGKFFPL